MNYVKVVDGKVVEGPSQMSRDASASPNIFWGPEQLRTCGYVMVDISCGPDEVLGEATVNADGSVTFSRIPKSAEELQAEVQARFNWKQFVGTLLEAFGFDRAKELHPQTVMMKELIEYPNWPGVAYMLATETALTEAEKQTIREAFLAQGVSL